MAIEALVVPTLDDYFDRGIDSFRQLVSVTYSLDYLADSNIDWSLVAVFSGIGASDAAANGLR